MQAKNKIEISGVVNFPIKNPVWENSKEGGIVVKLVVVEPENVYWRKCIGTDVYNMYDGSFIYDDKRPKPKRFKEYNSYEDILKEEKMIKDWESYHFPYLHNKHEMGEDADFISIPYLAALVIGTTNWTGWNKNENRYWGCTYDDLTEKGKILYKTLQELYKGCDLHILTFLDT